MVGGRVDNGEGGLKMVRLPYFYKIPWQSYMKNSDARSLQNIL